MRFNTITLATTALVLFLTMFDVSLASPIISREGDPIGGGLSTPGLVGRSENVDEYIEDTSNAITS